MSPRPEPFAAEGGNRTPLIGKRCGAYRITAHLGSGGMGDVYEVEHEELGRSFAMKVLRTELREDAETRTRFHREPRAVARLVSEHVVSIVDCGEFEDGTPYFVMERLYGSDLRRLLLRQGVLPIARVVHMGVDACRGLACAHRANLVHRDLKPENLFVTTRDDGRDLCKLLDFGIVKSGQDNTTQPGALLGTTRYMAPEQLGLALPVSPQTDLFALAVILYECLAGRNPFEGDTVERVLFKIMSVQEPPLRTLRPEVPEGLSALISRALSKLPEQRPDSALAFAEALLTYAGGEEPRALGSPWQLRVAEGDGPSVAAADPTPRALDPDALSAARIATARQSSRAVRVALPSVAFGLALGTLVATRMLRPEPSKGSAPSGSQPPPNTGAAPASKPSPPNNDAESRGRAEAASPPPSALPDSAARAPTKRVKTVTPGGPPGTRSAAPVSSFDPHNPYAP